MDIQKIASIVTARRKQFYINELIQELISIGAVHEATALAKPEISKNNIDLGLSMLYQAELTAKNMPLKTKLAMLRHTIAQRIGK